MKTERQKLADHLSSVILRRVSQPRNVDKGTWRNIPSMCLWCYAQQEMQELFYEISSAERKQEIIDEAGDVGAFLAMIVDNTKRQQQKIVGEKQWVIVYNDGTGNVTKEVTADNVVQAICNADVMVSHVVSMYEQVQT